MSVDPFRRAEEEFLKLKGQLSIGRITREQFEEALKALVTQDAHGRYWMLGTETGKWHLFDGQQWIPATPPPTAIAAPTLPPVPPVQPARVQATPAPKKGSSNCCLFTIIAGVVAALCIGGLGVLVLLSAQPTTMAYRTTVPSFATSTRGTGPTSIRSNAPTATRALATPSPTARPTATKTPPPLPSQITLKFDAGVSTAERQIIQNGTAYAAQELGNIGPVTVIAYSDLDAMMRDLSDVNRFPPNFPAGTEIKQAFQDGRVLGSGGSGHIWIWVGDKWKSTQTVIRWKTLTHEYFHNVQDYFSKKDPDEASPGWLMEGGADYVAYRSLDRLGMYSLDTYLKQTRAEMDWMCSPLSTLEKRSATVKGARSPYALGVLASDLLVNQYGGYDNLASRYWKNRATARTWQEAFETTFRVSVNTFYQVFEDYRKKHYPGVNCF